MKSAYVLVSPARNEAAYLPGVIESVLAQTILPLAWVVVSDDSTDATDAIVSEAAGKNRFICLLQVDGSRQRGFGSKARAFQAGYETLRHLDFAFVGNLDADVTFEAGYYERMLREMGRNPRLGVAGGVCWDKTPDGFRMITINLNHAVGAVQFFRRECYEAIGGYHPVSVGGVDSLAELTARMKGWETRSFSDLPFYHHKPVDSASGRTAVRICYRAGLTEYHTGTRPLFALAKAVRRWHEAPLVLSVFIRLFGYGKLWVSGAKRDASDELVAFLKREQMARLKQALWSRRASRLHTSADFISYQTPSS